MTDLMYPRQKVLPLASLGDPSKHLCRQCFKAHDRIEIMGSRKFCSLKCRKRWFAAKAGAQGGRHAN